jgi:hypothetical protein
MNIDNLEHALELLFLYNQKVRHKLIKLKMEVDSFLTNPKDSNRKRVIDFSNKSEEDAKKLFEMLQLEENVEGLIKKLDKRIHCVLRNDVRKLKEIIEEVLALLGEIKKSINDFGKLREHFKKIKQFISDSEKVLKRDRYVELLMKEIIDFAKSEWEDNIKDKFIWLFHGTSIIFLPYVQKYGLDSSSLPSKIKRSIERLSKIFERYGYLEKARGGMLDVDVEMSKKGISFAFKAEVRKHAWASNLPAFMYELLNKEHLRQHQYAKEIIKKLTAEEMKIFESIMAFGEELRSKNKVILLQVKLDSEFVKILGLPDFISDFDEFFTEYFIRKMNFNELMQKVDGRKASVSYLCKNIEEVFVYLLVESKVGTRDLTGVRIKKKIPPQFIYFEVQETTGYSLIDISEWNATKKPRLI